MAETTTTFLEEEDEQPMATEPIYLLSDESEYSTPTQLQITSLNAFIPTRSTN